MLLNNHDANDIEDEAYNALLQYIASCTVIVTGADKNFQHGSGVAVKYANQYYILTAAHVLKDEPDNKKIRIIGKPDAPIKIVHKDHLPNAIFSRTSGPLAYSTAVSLPIDERIIGNDDEDIAALEIHDAEKYLPHTIFHDLSSQGETRNSAGEIVNIFGFPGEIAQFVEHRMTREQGNIAFPQFQQREIRQIIDAPCELDPAVWFVTEYSFEDNTCNPKGLSGCGIWNIPKVKDNKIWSPQQSQLLGIQSAFYPDSKLLKVIRIERIIKLL